jgi:hypothetical protein
LCRHSAVAARSQGEAHLQRLGQGWLDHRQRGPSLGHRRPLLRHGVFNLAVNERAQLGLGLSREE